MIFRKTMGEVFDMFSRKSLINAWKTDRKNTIKLKMMSPTKTVLY